MDKRQLTFIKFLLKSAVAAIFHAWLPFRPDRADTHSRCAIKALETVRINCVAFRPTAMHVVCLFTVNGAFFHARRRVEYAFRRITSWHYSQTVIN